MNIDKLKLKHRFDLYKLSPEYPTNEDILFEYITGLEKNNKINEEFQNNILRKFSKKLPPDFKNEKEIMTEFVKLGYFKVIKTIKKTNTEFIIYKLIKHPWE